MQGRLHKRGTWRSSTMKRRTSTSVLVFEDGSSLLWIAFLILISLNEQEIASSLQKFYGRRIQHSKKTTTRSSRILKSQ
jgi:hypothetical protein